MNEDMVMGSGESRRAGSPDPPTREVIHVEDLALGYGNNVILKDLNFSIDAGEIITILGGSGCGKSTLLKALIGLLPPKQGNIFLGGERITGDNSGWALERARRKIGVLFQSGALLGAYSLEDNVALPMREFTDIPEELIGDVVRFKLGQVGLADYASYMPAELSGGMRKRAALARAIALDPQILFCDEPSAGLDPVTAADLDNLLMEMNRSLGITMVVITHELASIECISHRSIMLDRDAKGIIAQGDPRALKEGSKDPRVHAFFNRQGH